METYTFWFQTVAGYTFEEKRLTKRMAVIRYNRLEKNYNPDIKTFGWIFPSRRPCPGVSSLLHSHGLLPSIVAKPCYSMAFCLKN
jgi:hypothetical protein